MSLRCPFCDSPSVALVSLFGSQLLLSQYQCRACRTYFEGLRAEPEWGPEEKKPSGS